MIEPIFGLGRMRRYIFAILSLATAAQTAITPQQIRAFVIKETHSAPSSWRQIEDEVPDHVLQVRFGLKSANFDKLESHLLNSSDPFHEMYGAHLSREEVHKLMAPSDEALSVVCDWLREHDIQDSELKYSPSKDWITVSLPVRKVEKMLDTKYCIFEHESTGNQLVRALSWSLPHYLHEHIEVVQPTNSFFHPKSFVMPINTLSLQSKSTPAANSNNCTEDFVTPNCLRTLYGTIDYRVRAADNNSMALCNYLGEVSNRSDTAIQLKQFRPEAAASAYTFDIEVINNGNNNQGRETSSELQAGMGIEGDLDSETMLGIAWPTHLKTYNTGGDDDIFMDWLTAVLQEEKLPSVISTSYGGNEQDIPESQAKKTCEMFAQLGARGVSVIFASGDSGVGEAGTCVSNDGTLTPTFLAVFPASCPWVTTVGGTRNFNPERVAYDLENGYVSGGGLSRYFPRPSYQDQAVSAYVKSLGGLYRGLYNPQGRGYPDVAAQGYQYAIVWDGKTTTVDGTSAATPCFAAIVALLNDARLAAGLPTLGFLNPFIYSSGFNGLNDITVGSATGCATTGFPATKGWDAASGYGTPDFKKLLSLVVKSGSS